MDFDTNLLRDVGTMDYSLLLGYRNLRPGETVENPKEHELMLVFKIIKSWLKQSDFSSKRSWPLFHQLHLSLFPCRSRTQGMMGTLSCELHEDTHDVVFYIGIVDFITPMHIGKLIEVFFRYPFDGVSRVTPRSPASTLYLYFTISQNRTYLIDSLALIFDIRKNIKIAFWTSFHVLLLYPVRLSTPSALTARAMLMTHWSKNMRRWAHRRSSFGHRRRCWKRKRGKQRKWQPK